MFGLVIIIKIDKKYKYIFYFLNIFFPAHCAPVTSDINYRTCFFLLFFLNRPGYRHILYTYIIYTIYYVLLYRCLSKNGRESVRTAKQGRVTVHVYIIMFTGKYCLHGLCFVFYLYIILFFFLHHRSNDRSNKSLYLCFGTH